MAPVLAHDKALVTGANGYIAALVVRTLLEQGYSVLGTVRSASKGEHLKRTFASYGDKFGIAVVEDITQVRNLILTILSVVWLSDVTCIAGRFRRSSQRCAAGGAHCESG